MYIYIKNIVSHNQLDLSMLTNKLCIFSPSFFLYPFLFLTKSCPIEKNVNT